MENVAHTVAGLLLAEASVIWLARSRRGSDGVAGPRPSHRAYGRIAYWLSAICNNLPDGDMVYTGITEGKLGYLLHHRGHTHTLLGAMALSAIAVIVANAIGRRKGLSDRELRALAVLGVIGPIVHLCMDGLNVYGVHPFWPLDDRWHYGDAVFIVEPLFWMVGIPPIVFAARSNVLRGVLGCLWAAMLVLPWVIGELTSIPIRVGLAIVGVLAVVIAHRASAEKRVVIGAGSFVAVALVFVVSSQIMKSRFVGAAHALWPENHVLDVVRSSGPANPVCWSAIVVMREPGDVLVQRNVTASMLPSVVPVDGCERVFSPATADVEPTQLPNNEPRSTAGFRWEGEVRADIAVWRRLVAHNCEVAALSRFVRAPFWVHRDDGKWVVGDLRFDRDEDLDFAEMEIDATGVSGRCPRNVPPWVPPRADLTGPSAEP